MSKSKITRLVILTAIACVMFVSIGFGAYEFLTRPQHQAVTQPGDESSPTVPGPTIRQWATDAIASSQYSDHDWSALQAVGAPDTPDCGDMVTAWASASSGTVEWIILYYDIPIHVTEINIIQTYQPDQVVRVDLIDLNGEIVPLYTQEPQVASVVPCPYTLSIRIPQTDAVAQGIRITVDQSILGFGQNEIDAVELIGIPGRGEAVRPTVIPIPPTIVPVVTYSLTDEGSENSIEIYTDRASFEARLNGNINVVHFDDVDTSGDNAVLIEPSRYKTSAGIIISGEGGQYVDDKFGFPDEFRSVSSPNMYAPGPPATNDSPPPRGGHHTDITFSVSGERAAVAGFGAVFIDADYPGIGPSSIAIFDSNDRQLSSESGFSGPNGSQLFRGMVIVDGQGNPVPEILRVQLVNGNEWPPVDIGEGVTLDDFVFGKPIAR